MSRILCGNCQGTHSDIEQVKQCYVTAKVATVATLVPPTERQINFLKSLLEERVITDQDRSKIEAKVGVDLDKHDASRIIEWLLGRPKSIPKPAELSGKRSWDIPTGHYALNIDGVWKFYLVKQGNGRWTGYTFLVAVTGGPGDWQQHRVNIQEKQILLEEISKDPRQASIDFGTHTGSCGVCGSPLTNEESVAYGIGPVCRAKTGW